MSPESLSILLQKAAERTEGDSVLSTECITGVPFLRPLLVGEERYDQNRGQGPEQALQMATEGLCHFVPHPCWAVRTGKAKLCPSTWPPSTLRASRKGLDQHLLQKYHCLVEALVLLFFSDYPCIF